MLTRLVVLTLCGVLAGCQPSQAPKKSNAQVITVKKETLKKELHFTGTLQPLHETTLTSPMDAVVQSMRYRYGELVKKGSIVFVLDSTELQKYYNDTLTEYLKTKDSYFIAKAKFVGTTDLWDAGLISKNNFLSEKSSLNSARVAFMQSKHKLMDMLQKMQSEDAKKMALLSLAKFDKVSQALKSKRNLIYVRAPSSGVLLYPPKSLDEKDARIKVGSVTKSGQVIALLGDMSGLSVEISVPEVDVDKIHVNMPATISGVAFGGRILKGRVIALNAQASSSQGSSLPSFNAIIEVKHLTSEEQQVMKVGMSASIELTTSQQSVLFIPIAALKQENGSSIVKIQKPDGSIVKQKVTTGWARADKVVVTSGLKPGDKILYG